MVRGARRSAAMSKDQNVSADAILDSTVHERNARIHPRSRAVAFMRGTALRLLIAGVIGTALLLDLRPTGSSGGTATGLLVAGTGAMIFAAATLAFVAYILDLLTFLNCA